MNKWIAILLGILAAAGAPLAFAGQLATFSVIDRNSGERLQIWRHDGKNYVAGNPGDRYAVEVSNRTGARVLSVVSVDGVNVVSGDTAAASQTGYVLGAWQSFEIGGWRKSMDEVAAFYFTRLPDSYAARTGRADNVGVIGIALFDEYVEPAELARRQEQSMNDAAPTSAQAPAPMAAGTLARSAEKRAGSAADASLGTGHGERVTSVIRMTDFRRATIHPRETIAIYYDTYAHLAARGIIPRAHDAARTPSPFPGTQFPGNFVPDPS